jgi:hypothetical protein
MGNFVFVYQLWTGAADAFAAYTKIVLAIAVAESEVARADADVGSKAVVIAADDDDTAGDGAGRLTAEARGGGQLAQDFFHSMKLLR